MKNTAVIILMSLAVLLSVETQAQKDKKKNKNQTEAQGIVLKTHADTISYIIGHDIGKNLKTNDIEINQEIFNAGVANGIKGMDTLISEEETTRQMMGFQQEMMAKREQKTAQDAAAEKAKGQAFLEKNKTEPGVVETPTGLQYKVITEGSGESPTAEDQVEVHYTGKLLDGTVFDSSVERGETVTFPLNGVIPGWTEGLQLMKPGAKYIFYIPSSLAYGDRGAGPIPAGATLIFEVELKNVIKK